MPQDQRKKQKKRLNCGLGVSRVGAMNIATFDPKILIQNNADYPQNYVF